MHIDPIKLSRELLAFNTINPPGQELNCIRHLERILSEAGLQTSVHVFAPDRANLIARIGESNGKSPLCFTGHVDTVPLGNAAWSVDPFAGDIVDGKLYGRGTSDMKCGVAAFVAAICGMTEILRDTRGAVLVITAGEEIGCEGAFELARAGVLGQAGAIVVAEPTSNVAVVGHKGALWLKLILRGVTAHGSMPHLGVNAAYKAARAITLLENFQFNTAPHPYLGSPTLNIGTVHAGLNVNSVPDRAEIGVDIRSIPGSITPTSSDSCRRNLATGPNLKRWSTSVPCGPIPPHALDRAGLRHRWQRDRQDDRNRAADGALFHRRFSPDAGIRQSADHHSWPRRSGESTPDR